MRESLAGDQITRVMGIVNGNKLHLDQDARRGREFDVLKEAQALVTRNRSTADIEGYDCSEGRTFGKFGFHSSRN